MWKKWFGFNPQTMKIHTEVMAGITSFLAMAYILAVNPAILSVWTKVRYSQQRH